MDEPKMNRDDIIRIAGESWLTEYGVKELSFGRDVEIDIEALEQFAALVAAAEREACAKTIDEMHLYGFDDVREFEIATLQDAAKAIRARSQNDGH